MLACWEAPSVEFTAEPGETVLLHTDGLLQRTGEPPGVSDKLAENMKSGWADTELHDLQPIPQAAETAARRATLSPRFPGERLVIPSNNLKTRSNDTEYSFRASVEYAHLTGNQAEDGVLVLKRFGHHVITDGHGTPLGHKGRVLRGAGSPPDGSVVQAQSIQVQPAGGLPRRAGRSPPSPGRDSLLDTSDQRQIRPWAEPPTTARMGDRPLRTILNGPHCAVGLVSVLMGGPTAVEAVEDFDHRDARLTGPVEGACVVSDGRLGEGGSLGPNADLDASAVAVNDVGQLVLSGEALRQTLRGLLRRRVARHEQRDLSAGRLSRRPIKLVRHSLGFLGAA
ncbi:aminopeptidase P N-terminal domain-containing protein [Streptomyces ipomoeae]|nr:aminopeptidase P N-terminal domain-containing protein [Streptomyces ipomoeae]MDX2820467.1 aminopeptidase P N-terminal domain-containing protein [Streptomyces ipomoeae]MDX2874823.1 aminopeptidase P N-terminal domain-containing protein [Streptomyces ipomoeae]